MRFICTALCWISPVRSSTSRRRIYSLTREKDAILALLIRHIHAAIDAVKGKPGQIFAISVGIPGYLNEDKSIALSHFRLKGLGKTSRSKRF